MGVVICGGSFTCITVNVKAAVVVASPSLKAMVMVALPNSFVTGKTLAVRLLPLPLKVMLLSGTSVGFVVSTALSVKLPAKLSTSPTVNGIVATLSSFVMSAFGGGTTKRGASFTELIVSTKLVESVSAPSLTVTVMVTEPNWLVAGQTVTIRS